MKSMLEISIAHSLVKTIEKFEDGSSMHTIFCEKCDKIFSRFRYGIPNNPDESPGLRSVGVSSSNFYESVYNDKIKKIPFIVIKYDMK